MNGDGEISADPDGNALMLHHRYAPRTTEG